MTGNAGGVKFEPPQGQRSLEAGASEVVRLRATKRRALERLESYLQNGSPEGPVVAKIEVAGADPLDGSTATRRLKVRLRL